MFTHIHVLRRYDFYLYKSRLNCHQSKINSCSFVTFFILHFSPFYILLQVYKLQRSEISQKNHVVLSDVYNNAQYFLSFFNMYFISFYKVSVFHCRKNFERKQVKRKMVGIFLKEKLLYWALKIVPLKFVHLKI